MCGRYTHNLSWGEIVTLYRLTLPEEKPAQERETWNAAPTQPLPIIRPMQDSGRELVIAGWGLIPNWLKKLDAKAMSTINARCESVREKPTFRQSFERRRCIVPATGWYEWAPAGTKKVPVYHTVTSHPMAFAGIWDRWTPPDDGGRVSRHSRSSPLQPALSRRSITIACRSSSRTRNSTAGCSVRRMRPQCYCAPMRV
jgi:putative SOS response-associated peptidase YedK